MAAWGLLVPLFAGPDESSSYIRAAAIVRGELVGADHPPSLFDSYYRTTVDIDPQFGAPNKIPWCFAPVPSQPACDLPIESVEVDPGPPFTMQGRYPPVALVAPGVATYVGANDGSARLGRLLDAAIAAGLLGLAAHRLARSAVPIALLLVVWTPGAQFMGAVISPSGLEIAAAIAVWVYLPAALRRGSWSRRDDLALAAAAVALVTARQLGAAILLLIALACMVAAGDRGRIVGLPRRIPISLVAAGAATLGMLGWYVAVFSEHLSDSVADGEPAISRASVVQRSIDHLPAVLEQHVGNFGWLDTPSPTAVVWYFLAVLVAVVVASWGRATQPERLAVVGLAVAILIVNVYLDLGFYRLLRIIGVQGRHLTPLIVGLPLLLAHRWRPGRTARRALAVSWPVAVSLSGLFALRRYAVGIVPDNFLDTFTDPVWTPVLGIVPSLALLAAASALFSWVCAAARVESFGDGPRRTQVAQTEPA